MHTLKSLGLTACVAGVGLLALTNTGSAWAGTLETLERERAGLVATFLDGSLTPAQRSQKVEKSTRRLIDLERMALRDDSLVGGTHRPCRRRLRTTNSRSSPMPARRTGHQPSRSGCGDGSLHKLTDERAGWAALSRLAQTPSERERLCR